MAQHAGGHHSNNNPYHQQHQSSPQGGGQHQSVPRGASNDPSRGSESVYAILAPESSAAAPVARNPPPAPLNPKHIQQRLPAQGQPHANQPYHPTAAPSSHDQQQAAHHNSPPKKQIPAHGRSNSNSTASNVAPPPQQHHQQVVAPSSVGSRNTTNVGMNANQYTNNMMMPGSMSGEEEFHPAASLPFEIVYCSSEVQGRQIAGEGPHGSKLPTPIASKNGSSGGDKIGEQHTVGEIMKSLEMHWDELEANNESGDTSTANGVVDASKNHHGKPPVLSNGWLTHPAPNSGDDPEALEDSFSP
eukprot:GFYU01048913.1.p1 GENE.GFYU01048913.1~~GFYU01048913.1.p1  ORF type:complete len:316 (-),score=16.76 GFYU01048913.1:5-910(-)